MPFEIGTANNHYDLLDKLILFITTNVDLVNSGQNWSLIKDIITPKRTLNGGPTTAVTLSDYREVYLRGPGLANQDEIYCNILAYNKPDLQQNNWRIFGATGYDELESRIEYQPGSFFTTIGSTTYPTYYVSSNALMDYWLVANGRRFHMVVKIEGDFYYMHMGFLLPFGKPSEVPYPLLITGNDNIQTATPASISLYNLGSPTGNADSRNTYRNINGQWGYIGINYGEVGGLPYMRIWPWPLLAANINTEYQPVGDPTGGYPIMPATITCTTIGYKGVHGEVQGLYYVPKVGNIDLNSEDTLTIDGKTYIVFQNVDKNSRFDYSAMLLE